MTMTSITEARIRDHRRNAKLFLDFAALADEDGKVCMATLYRTAAESHTRVADRLESQINNVLDSGRGVLTATA
jgi:rubrerythrin